VQKKIEGYNKLGYNKFPICMAKTSNSLTGNPAIKGAPIGFTLDITDIFVSVGAGFIVPMVGEVNIFILSAFHIVKLENIHSSINYPNNPNKFCTSYVYIRYIVMCVSQIMMMPGLATRPSIYDMDWNSETDEIEGLF